MEGSPGRTSWGSHLVGDILSFSQACAMDGDLSLMQPVEWETSRETEGGHRGMLFGVATRSQFLTGIGLLDTFPRG